MKAFLKPILQNKILRFLLVGGCSTAIDFVVYMLLFNLISINFAKAISMLIASIFSYIGNKLFTFKDNNKTNVYYLIKFYIVFFLNFLTNVMINNITFAVTQKKVIAFVIATFAGMSVNYLGQKFFVFKIKNESSYKSIRE